MDFKKEKPVKMFKKKKKRGTKFFRWSQEENKIKLCCVVEVK